MSQNVKLSLLTKLENMYNWKGELIIDYFVGLTLS